jgi:hypothetical protein
MSPKKQARTIATPVRTSPRQPELSPLAAALTPQAANPDEVEAAQPAPQPPDAATAGGAKNTTTAKATPKRASKAATALDADLTKMLTTRLTPAEHKALKALAVDRETTTQALVRGMVQALLKRSTI